MEERLRKYVDRRFRVYPQTNEIVELREELYSMMRDKYNDCLSSGMPKEKSYKKALTFMENYRQAIREVETGSDLAALRKKVIGTLAFSAFYIIALTCVYLYVSMVAAKSFESTWLIGVGGVFLFLIYLASNLIWYARMFDMGVLLRVSVAFLFLSLIPLIYVFPNLVFDELMGNPAWEHSWLAIPIIIFIYILTDVLIFGAKSSKKYFIIELVLGGLILTTAIYLSVGYFYNLWSIAWISYVLYLAVVALVIFISKLIKTGK